MYSESHIAISAPQDDTFFSLPEPLYYRHSQMFPTSSAREEPATVAPPISPVPVDPPSPLAASQTSYIAPRTKIQQGVWLYGSSVVYTADHPALRAYILEAETTLHLPTNLPEPLMALAALELFYHPESPVHWLFWSDEKKRETAELVNRIRLHKPQLIDCRKTSWNGIAEYMSVLSQVHGSGYRHRYEGEPWYAILVPPKVKSPARMPNLRKRKPAQLAALCESQELDIGDDPADILEPSRKRPKTKRIASERAVGQVVHPNDISAPEADVPSSGEKLLFAASSVAPSPVPDTPRSELSALPESSSDEPTPSAAPLRLSSRPKKPKRTPDVTPPPLIPSSSTSSTPTASEITTPPSLPVAPVRVRSTSHSSAETLIGGSRNRSVDRLSVETVVQSTSERPGKGKGREMKLEAIDLAVAMAANSADEAQLANENEGIRTRSRVLRAGSALTDESSKDIIDDVHPDPSNAPAKRRTASTRKRKGRAPANA